MKKIWKGLLAILACGMLVFGAAACGDESSSSSGKRYSSSNVSSSERVSSSADSSVAECEEHVIEKWRIIKMGHNTTCENANFVGVCTVCKKTLMESGRECDFSSSGTVAATCTEDGYDWKRCTVCDAYETTVINALDHDFGEWETYQAATCYLAGEEIRYCKRDGCTHSYYDDTPYHESRIIDALAPNDGHSVANGKCTRCQKTESTDLQFALSSGTYQCVGMGNCKDRDIIIPKTYNNKAVTSIAYAAFSSSFTHITVPDSVTSIGDSAFAYCYDLTSIEVDENNTAYKSIDGNLYTKEGKTLIQYAIGKTATSFTIPNGVTSIGDYAFYNCDYLTSVEIGNGVTSIGNSAFYYCYNLTSVKIGNNVTSIGDFAFNNCDNLTNVKIGDNVISIGYYAFSGCDNLTSIELPDSVTSIGQGAFSDCDNLTSVEIGDNVTSIGYFAFYNCDNLTSIEIGNNVTSIGAYAFSGCGNLTSVIFADTEGWKVGYNGTSISSADLADAGTAAYYLTDKYLDDTWTKQ